MTWKSILIIMSLVTYIQAQSVNKEKPNIIVIMADDLGYGDVGCYGAKPKNVKTPHIDRLAKDGLRFTSGYCSAATCTPTRYSFLRGLMPFVKKAQGLPAPIHLL